MPLVLGNAMSSVAVYYLLRAEKGASDDFERRHLVSMGFGVIWTVDIHDTSSEVIAFQLVHAIRSSVMWFKSVIVEESLKIITSRLFDPVT
ncbi:hypothetical protein BCON_0170g00240 [Botryotinia convoluta]|uniref:Uncharacterized protein n=1 Tax=Botryotinia convoluta TaxID=54673 RepID=A0A4Z1HQF6_9HELO|nr:hypothetical protein BCON_0170g00240 [Botryotinia convoluta]